MSKEIQIEFMRQTISREDTYEFICELIYLLRHFARDAQEKRDELEKDREGFNAWCKANRLYSGYKHYYDEITNEDVRCDIRRALVA